MALPEKLLIPPQAQQSFPRGPGGKAGGLPANPLPLGAGHRPAGGGKLLPLCRLFGVTAESLLDDVRDLAQVAEAPAGKRASRCLRALVLAGVGLAGNVSSSPGWRRSHAPCLL